MKDNPFPVIHYAGPRHFCDRNTELSILLEAFDNGRPLLLHSIRRIGKTGLIHHLHHHLRKKKVITVYVDMLDTQSDLEFLNKLIKACLSALEEDQDNMIRRVSSYFSKYKPTLTFDPYTGSPEIELDIRSPKEIDATISALSDMLKSTKKKVQISIDGYQQISHYKDTRIDASIRSKFQQLKHVHFLFSGSQQNLLLGLFNDAKRPMYSTTQQLPLAYIEADVYADFIKKVFEHRKVTISKAAINYILDWTYRHTYYTQYLCNRLYASGYKRIGEKEVVLCARSILKENEITFIHFQQLLSKTQSKLLTAIAKEHGLAAVTADFLNRYQLAESSTRQSLKALHQKEMIFRDLSSTQPKYYVYNRFLDRWLKEK